MIVYMLINNEPEGEHEIIAVYKTHRLAIKAMQILKGVAGDSFTYQYVDIHRYKVLDKARIPR